jgi:cytoskeletal protein RodZ
MSTPDSQDSETGEYNVQDSTIGVRLQLLREQKGLSIQEVSEETHISSSNLKAIEGENYDQLPADTFIRGLITIYGNFLGIDGVEAARIFFLERDQSQPRGKKNRPGGAGHSLSPKKLAEPSHVSSATIASILLLLIVVSFTAFCLYTGWNPFAYFLDKGGQPTTPPLIGTVAPGSGNMATNTVVSPKTQPAAITTREQDSSTETASNTTNNALPTVKHDAPPVHTSPDTPPEN